MITERTHNEKGQRIDVHAPSNIDPANYTLAEPLPGVPWYKSGPFFDYGSVAGTCDHCGHGIRYATKMVYTPTGENVTFGADCTDLIDLPKEIKDRAGYEFNRLKIRAANEKKALRASQEKSERFAAFSAQHPDIVERLSNLSSNDLGFLHSMKHALDQWGWLTDGQTNATKRIFAKQDEYLMRKIEQAANEVEPTAPVDAGRYEVTGEVMHTVWRNSDFGGAYKMLVRLDSNACKVWGTVPGHLAHMAEDKSMHGKKITFTATFKPKDGDQYFAYFSRPSKASVA